MAGFRAYYENLASAEIGGTLVLSPGESRHLCGSLRAKEGDRLSVFDLNGAAYEAVLQKASQKGAQVGLLERIIVPESSPKISIAQCLPKGGTFESIIAQSVQLGVSKIYPLISDRTIVRLDPKEAGKKHEKWTAHVAEAVKQSANMSGLKLEPVADLKNFLEAPPHNSMKIVASLERDKSRPLLSVMQDASGRLEEVCILIGPEGDLSPDEYSAAHEAGFIPADLGGNVMKSDVAAAYCAAVAGAFFLAKR